jgi:hypothetical protein
VRSRGIARIASVVSIAGLCAIALVWWLGRAPAPQRPGPVAARPPSDGRAPAAASAASPPPLAAPSAEPAPAAPVEASDASDAGPDGLERALRWSSVDLEAARRALPDNLYWEMGAPTQDPEVLEARARERARWNEAYGQVLSGNASEEEIHAYFAHRQRLSSDYLAFASHLLDRYRDVLPEQDVGLLELTVRMHHTRLQEVPRRLAEALERKQRQDALREAWLRDEARFAPPAAAAR